MSHELWKASFERKTGLPFLTRSGPPPIPAVAPENGLGRISLTVNGLPGADSAASLVAALPRA